MRTMRFTKILQVLACWTVVYAGGSAEVNAAANGVDPHEALQRLRASLAATNQVETLTAERALAKAGTNAIPVISAVIGTGDKEFRLRLVRALGGIGADEATKLLLERFLTDPDARVSLDALSRLQNRTIRTPVPHAQVTNLLARVGTEDIHIAGPIAGVLSKTQGLDESEVAASVVGRFAREITESPLADEGMSLHGAYLSRRAIALNQFVLAIANLNPVAVRPQLAEKLRIASDDVAKKWLWIALGISRDSSVETELLAIVRDEGEDVSLRALALRAYARAMGKQAVPVLKSYLTDKTPGADPRTRPMHIVAHDELARLNRLKAAQ